MVVFKLDAGVISRAVAQTIIPNMNKLTGQVKERSKQLAPVDTGEYIRGFKTKPAYIQGTTVIGELINDSSNASGVETGFRKAPVNWHKGPPRNASTRIYTGVGANVQQRASIEFIPRIPKILGSNQ